MSCKDCVVYSLKNRECATKKETRMPWDECIDHKPKEKK